MKRVFILFIAVVLLASGCTSGRDSMPTLSKDTTYYMGTFSLSIPAGWLYNESSDSDTIFFYPSQCSGMISLANANKLDLMDTHKVALFLSGYDSTNEDVEEIDLRGFNNDYKCYGVSYEFYCTRWEERWYNHLYLVDANTETAAVLISYPATLSENNIALFNAVIESNMLSIDSTSDLDNTFIEESASQKTGPIYDKTTGDYIYSKITKDYKETSWIRRVIGTEVYDMQDKKYVTVYAKPVVAEDNLDTVDAIINMIADKKYVDKASIDLLETLGVPAYIYLCIAGGRTLSDMELLLDNNGVPGDKCAQALRDYISYSEEGDLEYIADTIHENYLPSCDCVIFKYDDEIVYTVDFK